MRQQQSNLSPQERQAKLLREAEEQRMNTLEEGRRRQEAERAKARFIERLRGVAAVQA